MANAQPTLRRSPLARAGEIEPAHEVNSGVLIADLSLLPRLGFKGRGTIDAMKTRGVTVEAQPNKVFRQSDGGLCLALGPGEVLLLSGFSADGKRLSDIEQNWRIEDAERTYPLLRQDSHFWLAVRGSAAPAMFAKICGVDLRLDRFSDLSIAQTSIAKMSAIVARADLDQAPVFHILADSASALYFFSCLVDAGREFGCRMASLEEVRELETL